MSPLLSVLFGALVALASAAAVSRIRPWANQRDLRDLPGTRRLHDSPTPRGGGLAIVACTAAGVAAALPWVEPADRFAVCALVGCGSVVAAVSWLDDRGRLGRGSPLLRLVVQVAAAAGTVAAVGAPRALWLPVGGTIDMGPAAAWLAVLWIVGLTNAYNFMDGIDGLAGGQAVVAGVGWVLIGHGPVVLLGALLAGSSLGFLAHNWPPARIFMGDVGSTFLGCTFAAATLLAARGDPVVAVGGLLLLWPFVFDTLFTLLRRLVLRENVFAPHVSHLYQRLVRTGWSHRRVACAYLALATLGVGLAVGLHLAPGRFALATAIGIPLGCMGLLAVVWIREARS